MTPSTIPGPAAPRRRRVPAGLVAAALAVLLGVSGLVAGARQDGGPTADPDPAAPAAAGIAVGDITVTGAYIRQPASPDVAAAYLTVRNDGSVGDALVSAYCGAARTTTVHGDAAAMEPGQTAPQTPVVLPGNSVVSLKPAKGHIMLDGLTGRLAAGDTVSLLLRFSKAGQVLVDVPVIAPDGPPPAGATS